MPYGKGTYGSKVGRPSKSKDKKPKTKVTMPKVKTNFKGSAVDKVVGPTARGLRKSYDEVAGRLKSGAKKTQTKIQKSVSSLKKGINEKGFLGSVKSKFKKGSKKTKVIKGMGDTEFTPGMEKKGDMPARSQKMIPLAKNTYKQGE